MPSQEKLVYFGTGLGARRALRWRPAHCRIVAFTDDDSSKWGQRFHGYPIVAPHDLPKLAYDRVLVTTTTYARQVYQRLRDMGIPSSKIRTLPHALLYQDYPPPWQMILTVCNPGLIVSALLAMIWHRGVRHAGCADGGKRPTLVFAAALPVMPVQGGGVARLWSLVDFLHDAGYRIVLATLGHPLAQVSEMRRRVDRVWMRGSVWGGGLLIHSYLKWITALRAVEAWWKNEESSLIAMDTDSTAPAGVSIREPSFFDRRRNKGFEQLVAEVCRIEKPLALISLFAWSAPVYDFVSASVLKILDTIDVQHIRLQRATAAGASLPGFDPPPMREEESTLLSKADVILAIQSGEREELRHMVSNKPVLLVEHVHPLRPLLSPATSQTVFFVGNDYAPNVAGITAFLKQAWPEIRHHCPQAELVICGKVCGSLNPQPEEGVRCLDVVPDIEQYYAKAAVVINPVLFGTGLKIKAVEALAHGKCLVATEEGILGLPPAVREAAHVVSLSKMASVVSSLLQSIEARRELERRAMKFACEHFSPDRVYGELMTTLEERAQKVAQGSNHHE